MSKRYNSSDHSKQQQLEDDFEDFGYNIKNVRRSSKKKVAKFKREINEYDDSFWTVHYRLIFNPVRVVYTCSGFFHAWDVNATRTVDVGYRWNCGGVRM